MPVAPKSLFFARIVHRLLTNPNGWRVSDMMDEFEIQPRTYRNYRKTLQDELRELHDANGESVVQEVRDGEQLWLRIVDGRPASPAHDDYLSRIAAIYFANRLLQFLSATEIGGAIEQLVQDFQASLKDRSFALNTTLRNVDRMFYEVPAAPKNYGDKADIVRASLRGLVYNYWLDVEYESTRWGLLPLRLAPYTLATHQSALYLIARTDKYRDPRYYAVDRIKSVACSTEKFEYPSKAAYDPETWTAGGFGLFRGDDGETHRFELVFADKRWLKAFVQERRWSATQAFEERDDGRLCMKFRTSSDVQVWPWIRSFGDDVEVVTHVHEAAPDL